MFPRIRVLLLLSPAPDVLVPEPQVEIDRGSLAQQPTPPRTTPAPSRQEPIIPDPATRSRDPQLSPGLPRTVDPTPPYLPRAVAPPVGDIAVSNVNPAVQAVNLNTTEVIPRLVLRDALVRDVLSLLARTAGLNVAFASDFGNITGQGGAQGGTEALTISLDIENESVQDVFNYVLRLSGLEANRQGNTIFVGANSPTPLGMWWFVPSDSIKFQPDKVLLSSSVWEQNEQSLVNNR